MDRNSTEESPLGPSTLLRMVSLPFEGLRTVSLSNRSNHFVPASEAGFTLNQAALCDRFQEMDSRSVA